MRKITLVMCLFLGLAAISADAAWVCRAKNPVNVTYWVGVGPTRAIAVTNAMRFCASHSFRPRNCYIARCNLRFY